MRRSGVVAAAVAVVAAVYPSAAVRASCAAPPFEVLWSYPADGQTSVPTNAQVMVLTSMGGNAKAVLDGAELTPVGERGFRFETPPLQADAEHTLVLSTPYEEGETTLHFRTGSGPMASDPPDAEPSPALEEGERQLTETCARVLGAGDCYDTGQDTHLTLRTSQAPLAWTVEFLSEEGRTQWIDLWPGTCGSPEIYVHATDDRCYRLTAYNEIGEATVAGEYCQKPGLLAPLGCATAGAGAAPWLAALTLLACRLRRRHAAAPN